MDYSEILKLQEELSKYADLEGTEIGEACTALCQLLSYADYVSEEFYSALIDEVQGQLVMFKESCEIVEKVETFPRTVTHLEWH